MIRSRIAAALMLLLTVAPAADAGCHRARRRAARRVPAPCRPVAATPSAYPVAPMAPAVAPSAQDPGTFLGWLNAERARNGLGPVGYSPDLAGWAQANNGQQQARGLGHHVMGPARRQNSGMGDLAAVSAGWMASPPHQAALLDPTITAIGLAGSGAYWTFSAY